MSRRAKKRSPIPVEDLGCTWWTATEYVADLVKSHEQNAARIEREKQRLAPFIRGEAN